MQYISDMQTILSCFVIISEATSQSIHHKICYLRDFRLPVLVPLGIWPIGFGGGLSVVAREVEQIKDKINR